jgi:peptide methionine sulfoxide reductase MsrA
VEKRAYELAISTGCTFNDIMVYFTFFIYHAFKPNLNAIPLQYRSNAFLSISISELDVQSLVKFRTRKKCFTQDPIVTEITRATYYEADLRHKRYYSKHRQTTMCKLL